MGKNDNSSAATTTFLRPQEAAAQIGISYATLKQWIYARKIKATKTVGGHYRIPAGEVERLTRLPSQNLAKKPVGIAAISSRNKMLGTVVDVKVEGLMAQVTLDIGGHQICAIVTRESCDSLGLKLGARAYALVKATEVMLVRT